MLCHLRTLLGLPFHLSASRKGMSIERWPDYHPEGVDWTLPKYTAKIEGRLILDTSLGWAIRGRELLTTANPQLLDTPAYPKPNCLHLLRRKRHFAELIWMPYGLGNYWHFFNDFLGGLSMLETEAPILISPFLRRSRFFREAQIYSTRLQNATFVTPEYQGEWLTTDRLHTAIPWFGAARTFRDAHNLLDQLPPVKSTPQKNIIIARQGARQLPNLSELKDALGYEVVYFEGLSLLDQREIVNGAKNIVALHGAGMANLAFHENPDLITVVELRPTTWPNPCFSYLCREMCMNYQVIEYEQQVDIEAVLRALNTRRMAVT